MSASDRLVSERPAVTARPITPDAARHNAADLYSRPASERWQRPPVWIEVRKCDAWERYCRRVWGMAI